MATESFHSLLGWPRVVETREIIIDPEGDLNILVHEYDDGKILKEPDPKKLKLKATFVVNKARLDAASDFFRGMLRAPMKESRSGKMELHGPNADAFEIWMLRIHDKDLESKLKLDILHIWHLLAISRIYDLDNQLLASFFTQWYNQPKHSSNGFTLKRHIINRSLDVHRLMMTPAYDFDDPLIFAKATKIVAYDSIKSASEDRASVPHKDICLPARVMHALRAAKGRVRNKISDELSGLIKDLVEDQPCTCCFVTVTKYLAALAKYHLWPMEKVWRTENVTTIISRMRRFEYKPEAKESSKQELCKSCMAELNLSEDGKLPTTDESSVAAESDEPCGYCTHADYTQSVRKYSNKIESYFDGLCLDCMERSSKWDGSDDQHRLFWDHYLPKTPGEVKWDKGCRIKHGQPTWYFSFLGQEDLRGALAKARKFSGDDW